MGDQVGRRCRSNSGGGVDYNHTLYEHFLELLFINFRVLCLLNRPCPCSEPSHHVGTSIQDKFNSVFTWQFFLFLRQPLVSFFYPISIHHVEIFFLWLNVPNFLVRESWVFPTCTALFFLLNILFIFLDQFLAASDPLRLCNPTFISIVETAIISSLFMIIYAANINCPQKQ